MAVDLERLFLCFDQALSCPDPYGFIAGQIFDAEFSELLLKLLHNHFDAANFLEDLVIPADVLQQISRDNIRFAAGEKFDDFEFIDVLGEGSFGVVYHAKQISLEREVALKVTPDFGDEAKTLARLEHDHIVPIFFQSENAERRIRMLCMPLLPGVTLGDILREMPLLSAPMRSGSAILQILAEARSVSQQIEVSAIDYRMLLQRASYSEACLMILSSVSDAVSFAHAQAVLHLDIKPDNILFDVFGRPKLADFNVSVTASAQNLVLGGTKAYMSPEQARAMEGEPVEVGPPSDVYALGKVLVECLSLEPAIANLAPIKSVVRKSLEQNPTLRPTAEELASALRRCLGYLRMRAELPKPVWGETWVRRHLILGMAAVMLVPNLIGSFVNIGYNALQIISHLTDVQAAAFHALILGYNILIYPVVIVLLVSWVRRCLQGLPKGEETARQSVNSVHDCRQQFSRLSVLLIFLSSLGWLAGAVVFPVGIDVLAGPVGLGIYVHFAISFIAAWLISMTYSYLGLQFLLTRVVYPELVDALQPEQPGTAIWDSIAKMSQFMLTLAVFIPLIGAVMVLFLGFDDLQPDTFLLMKLLISALITAGLCGFVVAFYANISIKRCLDALRLGGQSPPVTRLNH